MNRRGPSGIRQGERDGGATIDATLDPAIVDRARHGDPTAFDALVRDRMGTVYRLTLAIVGNQADAADATQEAFLAAWRQLGTLRDPERLDAWLARIAVNAARMVARGRRRRLVREIPGLSAVAGTLPASDDAGSRAADDARLLGAALERLPADQRTILALHHLEGRGLAEVGEVLGIPSGTAKSRLFAARRALAAAIEAEEAGR